MSDFQFEKKIKTKKEHRCFLCERKIPKGFTAHNVKGKFEEENAELKERLKFFNAVGNTVDKQTYNAVVNENVVLKKEIEKLRKHNLNIQKICFDSCL